MLKLVITVLQVVGTLFLFLAAFHAPDFGPVNGWFGFALWMLGSVIERLWARLKP